MSADKLTDLLGQDARVRGQSRMTARNPDSTISTRDTLWVAQQYMRDHNISQSALAKSLGIGAADISAYFNRELEQHRAAPITVAINNWMDNDFRARRAQPVAGFVPTVVAKRLFAAAGWLTERRDMAVAFGSAGVGKSMTARALLDEFPGSFLVTVTDDCRGARALKLAIFNAISMRRSTAATVQIAALVERLRLPDSVKTPRLGIIDQAHELSPRGMRILMDLHEHCHLSWLLLGTKRLLDQVSSDDDPWFGQIASRVGLRIDLDKEARGGGGGKGARAPKLFSVEDIRKLFRSAKNLKLHTDAARLLAYIASFETGHLRRASRLFSWAEKLALAADDDQILDTHIREAAGFVEERAYVPNSALLADDSDREAASA